MARYKGPCGTKDAVAVDSRSRVHFWVDLTNKGECPVKIRFFKSREVFVPAVFGLGWWQLEHVRQLTKTVQPGASVKIDRDEVNRVTISCDGEEEDGEVQDTCKFSYSIKID